MGERDGEGGTPPLATAADAGERRAALLLAALRLSRDPELLPRLEAALAPLDDGRHPRAARRAERHLMRSLHERVADTIGEEDEAAWDAERDAEAADGAAEMDAMRRGLAPRAGTPPEAAAAMRAAGELQARLDGGEAPAAPGAATAEGWTAVARLELEGGLSQLPADLWALLPPPDSGGRLTFVAAGALSPEVWNWPALLAEVHARRCDLALTEAFVRDALAAFLPAHAAGRASGAGREGLLEADLRTEDRRGAAVLHLLDGQPERAEGAALLGPAGEGPRSGVSARRVDRMLLVIEAPGDAGGDEDDGDDSDDGAEPPPDLPWAEQVWARPLGGGAWRRGRLRVEADGVAFVDEPAAGTGTRGDGAPPGGLPGGTPPGRDLERDLVDDGGIRRKAAGCAVYAQLLYAALENGRWRHADGTAWTGGQRSTGALVARVVGGGDYLDWAWGGPAGVLDEEVLADLRALGWEREAGG